MKAGSSSTSWCNGILADHVVSPSTAVFCASGTASLLPAPAVAAGCPVAIKPASATPLSCHALVDLLVEAGLPEDWAVVLPMPGRVAESLVTDPRIAFFSFIGSGEVGWGLRRKVADGVRCAIRLAD